MNRKLARGVARRTPEFLERLAHCKALAEDSTPLTEEEADAFRRMCIREMERAEARRGPAQMSLPLGAPQSTAARGRHPGHHA